MIHRMHIPFFMLPAVLCLSLFTLSCGSGGGATPQLLSAKPVITSFAVNPASITVGSDSTLSWKVSNATHLAIEPGIGDVTGSSSRSVSPATTTSYSLTATNAAGSTTRTALLIVNPSGGGLADVATRWNAGSPPELRGYKPFPANSAWNRNVSADPVDPDSDNIIADLLRDDPGAMLHPDFGNSLFEGAYVGHPYDVVAPSVTPMVHVTIGPEGYA